MILYKYYPSTDFSFRSLAMKALWCHYPRAMNDPFECLGYAERTFTAEQIRSFRSRFQKQHLQDKFDILKKDDDELAKFINDVRKRIVSKFAFAALSEQCDNLLMWSHYASAHTGFVIGIEFKNMSLFQIQKVSYVSRLPDYDTDMIARFFSEDVSTIKDYMSDISVKSVDWNYEKEWRLWQEKPGYIRYGEENIKEIYFGVNCANDTMLAVGELTRHLGDSFDYKLMKFKSNPVGLTW